jgi:hypothetical protein
MQSLHFTARDTTQYGLRYVQFNSHFTKVDVFDSLIKVPEIGALVNVIFFLTGSTALVSPDPFQFPDLFTVGKLVARPLPKHRTAQTQKNTYTHQTSMPKAGFEPSITAHERLKALHASDRSAAATGTH